MKKFGKAYTRTALISVLGYGALVIWSSLEFMAPELDDLLKGGKPCLYSDMGFWRGIFSDECIFLYDDIYETIVVLPIALALLALILYILFWIADRFYILFTKT